MRAGMRASRICGALALVWAMAVAAPADVRVIAIDPGHGGVDHGTRSAAGMLEKELSLRVSLRLAEELRKRGFRVVLTREKDEFIELTRRTEIANAAGAELFLSIHANSSPTRKARGPETYFVSLEASDEEARRVALAENDVFENAAAVDDGGDVVGLVLGDLIRTDHLRASSELAARLQHGLAALGVAGRGVKQAPFVVLMGANMPAALLEVGFLSHPGEAEKLASRAYQRRIARAIAGAVVEFSKSTPAAQAQAPEGAE